MYSEIHMRARSSENSQDVLEKQNMEEGLPLGDGDVWHKAAVIATCVTKAGVDAQAAAQKRKLGSRRWPQALTGTALGGTRREDTDFSGRVSNSRTFTQLSVLGETVDPCLSPRVTMNTAHRRSSGGKATRKKCARMF